MTSRDLKQIAGRKRVLSAGRGRGVCALGAIIVLLTGSPIFAAAPASPPSAPDVEAQYQMVMAEMKHPASTGILVTEIEPDSPAGAAGLQAGDIIYHYAGSKLHDLDALRKSVAEQIAASLTSPPTPVPTTPGGEETNVLLGVHRAEKDVVLQVPQQPLGIRAIEVEAGVPAAPNPPPSIRGSISLAWGELARQHTTESRPDYFRTIDATGGWTSWQSRSFLAGDGNFDAQFENHHVDPANGNTLASESVTLHVRTGDYAHEPAFLLDSLEESIHTPDGALILATAERRGLTLRTQGKTSLPSRAVLQPETDHACPMDALPEPAVPILAAAFPLDAGGGAGLQFHLLSTRDFLARPGYLLISRGKQKRVADSAAADEAWRVDLLHCGVVIQTFWFDNQRQLLQLDSPTAGLIARRVATQEEATAPAIPKVTATQEKFRR